MKLKSEWLRYGSDREYSGLVAWPENAQKPMPAVIVIQEVWGLDDHIEDVCRRFAEAGYVSFSPDLYSRNGERTLEFTRERMIDLKALMDSSPPTVWSDPKVRETELQRFPAAKREAIQQTFEAIFSKALKLDQYVPMLTAASGFLRNDCELSRGHKVGVVGFCMGGGLSALLACHDPKLGAAVIFYGSAPVAEKIPGISCPVLGLYGGLDAKVNEGIPAFAEAMQKQGKVYEKHIYDGVKHAFFNDTRPAYHSVASRDAFARTLEFFRKSLA